MSSSVISGQLKEVSNQQEKSPFQETFWKVMGHAPKCITAIIVASRGLAALGKMQIDTALSIEAQAVSAYAIPLLTQSLQEWCKGHFNKSIGLMAATMGAAGYSSYAYVSALRFSTQLVSTLVQDEHSLRVIIEEVKVFTPPGGYETISACILGGAALYCVSEATQTKWLPSRVGHIAASIFCAFGLISRV